MENASVIFLFTIVRSNQGNKDACEVNDQRSSQSERWANLPAVRADLTSAGEGRRALETELRGACANQELHCTSSCRMKPNAFSRPRLGVD
jgi:hypothetical protein